MSAGRQKICVIYALRCPIKQFSCAVVVVVAAMFFKAILHAVDVAAIRVRAVVQLPMHQLYSRIVFLTILAVVLCTSLPFFLFKLN